LSRSHPEETLDDLDENDVFARCLAVHEVPEEQRAVLTLAYQETLASLHNDDLRAE